MGNLSIKKTPDREDRFRRLLEATGENTVAGAIDVAVQHYLADLQNKRMVAINLTPEQVESLSTPYLPLEMEAQVGRNGADGQ